MIALIFSMPLGNYRRYISTAVLFIVVSIVAGCNKTITEGGYNDLNIGMTKSQVKDVLIQNGVTGVSPHVDRDLIISSSGDADELLNIEYVQGICVTNNSGYSFHISFDAEDTPVVKYVSIPARDLENKLNRLSSRREVVGFIKNLMQQKGSLIASNCIIDMTNIHLKDASADAKLNRYNSWFYYIPQSYSTSILRFSGGMLTKIEFSWRPFEMP